MTLSAVLPSWEMIPPDIPAAIAAVKDAIRRNMLAHGTTIEAAIAEAEKHLHDEIAEIAAIRARGDEVWPVLQFDDVASGRMDEPLIAAIRRRGCVVVKGTFNRSTAEAWDAD
jgi:hypothetical protein